MKYIKKNIIILSILSGLSSGVLAQGFSGADSTGQSAAQSGFGGNQGISTVAQVKSSHDDAWVVLEGNIVRQTGHERYEFRDSSGTITVEIDDESWYGQRATPANKIHIEGEVDRNWGPTEVDVKNMKVMK